MADKAVAERQQWMVIALVIATILSLTIAAITIRISIYQNRQLQATLTQLEVANRKIQERQETSEAVSKEVLQLSAELKSNANQQATGSQQQLAVVSQVNTTVIKLSNTAAGIAKLSAKISEVAVGVATDSQQIEQTTGLSAEQSQQGVAALNSAIQVSEELALLYQQLMETFNTLRSKATNMRRILELLHSITTETHLLSLNAAIEAAGSGQNGTRFRVVAQEVKNLALRSSQSNQEVIGIVRELESVVDEALTSVESGHHKTEEMKEVVGEASTVIEKMRTVSEHSQQQANTINQAVQEAKVMMDEIKFATSQQQNASQQVCEVLNGLSVVAQQTAVGSNLVALTAVDLEKLSNQLNLALANA
jgi:methyl-accepting chemotaxis protein